MATNVLTNNLWRTVLYVAFILIALAGLYFLVRVYG